MSVWTYGPGYSGNFSLNTPSGGGTFPAMFAPLGYSPEPGEITRSAAPSETGTGSSWSDVLKQLAVQGGTLLAARLFGGDSRSAAPRSEPGSVGSVSSSVQSIPGQIGPAVGPRRTPTPLDDSQERGPRGIDPAVLALGGAVLLAVVLILRR